MISEHAQEILNNVMEDFLISELECLDLEPPKFNYICPDEFNNWSDSKWITKEALEKIRGGENAEDVLYDLQSKTVTYAYRAKDQNAVEMFMNAYYTCEYLLDRYYELAEDLESIET